MCFYAYCGQNTSIKYTVKRYLVGANDLTKRFLNGHTFCVAYQVRCIFLRPSDNYSEVPIKRNVVKKFRMSKVIQYNMFFPRPPTKHEREKYSKHSVHFESVVDLAGPVSDTMTMYKEVVRSWCVSL